MTSYPKAFIGLIFITGAILLMPACSKSPMKARYYIGFVNKTGHDLDGVCAFYGVTKVAQPSWLGKDDNATEGLIPVPIPSEAEVQWDENGTHHAVKVKLEGVVPPGLDRFTLYFIIKADGSVDAKAIKLSDIDANANVTK
jgi:hypothetical protein